jgi:hypothetical protein
MPVNTPEKEKRRFFAITSLGKSRWYWVVWPSLDEVRASAEPLLHAGEGYEKTKAEAVERALELAGKNAEWIAAKYARIYHDNQTISKRKRSNSRAREGENALKMHEYVYRDVYDIEIKKWVSVPHRVMRKTRQFVFIEQQSYSPGELTGSWFDQKIPTFRLDRRMLEREGYAFIPATIYVEDAEEIFFSNEYTKASGEVQIRCIQRLNLVWPCTETDVKRAYRTLAKSAHPDGGGSQDKFLALQEAYVQALQFCHRHAEATNPPKKEP